MNVTPAVKALAAALQMVESKSVQNWAISDHNYPHFLKDVEGLLAKGKFDPTTYSIKIVSLAIGLW